MIDVIFDGLIDTLKLLPYLFITFLILELLEHKLSKKSEKILAKNKKFGPIIGGLLGGLPQCGFSAMASNLFSNKVITMGTLIAIYLSTSDEMLPIMISEHANIIDLLMIIGFKVVVGIVCGFIIDLIFKKKEEHASENIHEMCCNDHCDCHDGGIFISSIKHSLKIGLFILIVNLLLNTIIFYVGEDNLSRILLNKNIFTYFLSSLVGLIPNCCGSVIITELYLSKMITIGTLLSGLFTGSGIGILVLFRTNKNIKENITILSLIYIIGVIVGIVVDLFI